MIQDRQFDTSGQLLWPDSNNNPSLVDGPPSVPDIHPFWIPEFFGDVMCVNGRSWPFLKVEPRRVPEPAGEAAPGWHLLSRPALRAALPALCAALSDASARSVTWLGAAGVVVVGVVPMAATGAQADPLIARAISGPAMTVSRSGQPVSLASLRGRVTLLTFLDPRCTTDCPVATELKEAGSLLGSDDTQARLVAIAASQSHHSPADIAALDRADGLDATPNWLFRTGSLPALEATGGKYGIFVSHMTPGASSVMSDLVFIIDARGQIRLEVRDNPGPGTITTRSSFAMLLADSARQVLRADTGQVTTG